VLETNPKDDRPEPGAHGVDERWPDGPPSKELDDLIRAASRLLGLSAFTVSIVAGKEPFPRGTTILAEMAEERRRALLYSLCFGIVDGEPLIVEDTSQAQRPRDVKAFELARVGSCLCFPLRANGWQVIGLFCLVGREARTWRRAELSLVGELAQLAAIEMRREADLEIYSGNDLHLRTRRAVMSGLLGGGAPKQATEELLGGLCRNLQWDAGGAWLSGSAEVDGLACVGRWSRDRIDADAIAGLYGKIDDDADMLGQVWTCQEPTWTSDLSSLTDVRRAALASQAGFGAGLWFPVINDGNALGVIELLATQAHPDHDRLPLFVLSLGRQIGDVVALTAPQAVGPGSPSVT
jgi:GAF domain-containing protein